MITRPTSIFRKIFRVCLGFLLGGGFGFFGLLAPLMIIFYALMKAFYSVHPIFGHRFELVMTYTIGISSAIAGVAYVWLESRLPRRSVLRVCVHLAAGATIGFLVSLGVVLVLHKLNFFMCDMCGESHFREERILPGWVVGIAIGCLFSCWHWFRRKSPYLP